MQPWDIMMSEAKIAVLPDRGVVGVKGEDAEAFLQGLVTNDVLKLRQQSALLAGLLSPQGKILFDFLIAYDAREVPVVREGKAHAFLIDVARDMAPALVKRLSLYKLRARVNVEDLSDTLQVMAQFGTGTDAMYAHQPDQAALIIDPRSEALGARLIVPAGQVPLARSAAPVGSGLPAIPASVEESDYHKWRIALGVPEGGKDYDFGDAFPHEADFDFFDGVSFEKGCYVGQEIVSRMEHRGTARKRVVLVEGASALAASRPDVLMGDIVIGRLGSVAGRKGLALLRLDRAIEAIDKGVPIKAGGIDIEVDAGMIGRQRKLVAEKVAHP